MRQLVFIFSFIVIIHSANFEANAEQNEYDKLTVMTFEEFQPLLTPDDDKVYVFNFWATWCKPCLRELPYFEELQEKYSKQGVEVVLVSLDFIDHLESHLMPYLERNPKQSRVILLNAPRYNQWIHKVSDEWSGAIPATIFVSNKGQNHKFYQQEFNFAELEEILSPLLKQ